MKVFRTINGKGKINVYVQKDHEVFRWSGEPLSILVTFKKEGKVALHEKVGLTMEELLKNEKLITPYDPPEIWGAGIVYERARVRYTEEDVAMIKGESIYEIAYVSERPELFFKDVSGRRSVGHEDFINVRSDSNWTLPEPELGVVLDSDGSILGYTVCNDVTARDIEAQNPLYLPQAKIYRGCFSFGPSITTPDEIADPHNLVIKMRILRNGDVIFVGETNTSKMKKRIETIVAYLLRDNIVPSGTLISTGTGIIPGKDVQLKDGDRVEIYIEKIGTLVNYVRKLR
ncbi:MAG: fumarylacetoacetate hydrolase family protein [Nitrososphaerota archaeon]